MYTTTAIQVDITPQLLTSSLVSIIGSSYQRGKLFFIPEVDSDYADDEVAFVAHNAKEAIDFLHSSTRKKWN